MRKVTALLTLWVTMLASVACTPQQGLAVVQDIQKFTPAVINVATAICDFTPAAAICATAGTAVSASAAILETALTNYYTALANGTVPPSVLQEVAIAIATFENDANNILTAVHVVDPIHQREVEAVAAAASVLLAVVEALFPSTASQKLFAAHLPSGGAAGFSLNAWCGQYNSKVSVLEKSLPGSRKLVRVHDHNFAMRVVSFGSLK